jgi:hypothetical protein
LPAIDEKSPLDFGVSFQFWRQNRRRVSIGPKAKRSRESRRGR